MCLLYFHLLLKSTTDCAQCVRELRAFRSRCMQGRAKPYICDPERDRVYVCVPPPCEQQSSTLLLGVNLHVAGKTLRIKNRPPPPAAETALVARKWLICKLRTHSPSTFNKGTLQKALLPISEPVYFILAAHAQFILWRWKFFVTFGHKNNVNFGQQKHLKGSCGYCFWFCSISMWRLFQKSAHSNEFPFLCTFRWHIYPLKRHVVKTTV